jgi:predicted phosphodiesterase
MRVFAVSDLHIDYASNCQWVRDLSLVDYQDDILLLGGDISHKIPLIEACFKQMVACFKHVIFVPGNHDLWVRREQGHSLDKFYQLQALAADCGVSTSAYHQAGVSLVPLYSWYDFSFGACSDYLKQRWMDFICCQWPEDEWDFDASTGLALESYINAFFLNLNRPHLAIENETIISFSHFLPRIDVMPSYIPKQHQLLYPVLGCQGLDEQVRELGSSIHVYGHSHVNRQVEIEGIRYINNAFGGPGEERISAKALLCVYDDSRPGFSV